MLLCLITALSGPIRQRRGSIPIDRGHPSSRSRIASWSSVRRTYNCIVVAMSSCPMTFASLFGTIPHFPLRQNVVPHDRRIARGSGPFGVPRFHPQAGVITEQRTASVRRDISTRRHRHCHLTEELCGILLGAERLRPLRPRWLAPERLPSARISHSDKPHDQTGSASQDSSQAWKVFRGTIHRRPTRFAGITPSRT